MRTRMIRMILPLAALLASIPLAALAATRQPAGSSHADLKQRLTIVCVPSPAMRSAFHRADTAAARVRAFNQIQTQCIDHVWDVSADGTLPTAPPIPPLHDRLANVCAPAASTVTEYADAQTSAERAKVYGRLISRCLGQVSARDADYAGAPTPGIPGPAAPPPRVAALSAGMSIGAAAATAPPEDTSATARTLLRHLTIVCKPTPELRSAFERASTSTERKQIYSKIQSACLLQTTWMAVGYRQSSENSTSAGLPTPPVKSSADDRHHDGLTLVCTPSEQLVRMFERAHTMGNRVTIYTAIAAACGEAAVQRAVRYNGLRYAGSPIHSAVLQQARWVTVPPDGASWTLPHTCLGPLEFLARSDAKAPAERKALLTAEEKACGTSPVYELLRRVRPPSASTQCLGVVLMSAKRIHVTPIGCKRVTQ